MFWVLPVIIFENHNIPNISLYRIEQTLQIIKLVRDMKAELDKRTKFAVIDIVIVFIKLLLLLVIKRPCSK